MYGLINRVVVKVVSGPIVPQTLKRGGIVDNLVRKSYYVVCAILRGLGYSLVWLGNLIMPVKFSFSVGLEEWIGLGNPLQHWSNRSSSII